MDTSVKGRPKTTWRRTVEKELKELRHWEKTGMGGENSLLPYVPLGVTGSM